MTRREKLLMLLGQLVAIGMIAMGAIMLYADEGDCAMCPTFDCYGKCFTPDCVCMSLPGAAAGRCYGAGIARDMEQMGWVRY